MSKKTNLLLVLSLYCLTAGLIFVTGTVNVWEAVGLYVTLPAGAIFFGLFLISMSLQGASALFDEEQRKIVAAIAIAARGSRQLCCEPTAQVKESVATARPARVWCGWHRNEV